ncbi:MAG: hypothetical protein AAF614_42250 [Chloroflexota bacterium]
MGFPTWTLWGMGVMVFLALLLIGLAYLAQTPRLLLRLGLSGYRLDLQVRALTGYAFACLLLLVGFFLAGVPLGGETAVSAAATTPTAEPTAIGFAPTAIAADPQEETAVSSAPTAQPEAESAPAIATSSDVPAESNEDDTSTGAFVPDPTATPTPDLSPTPSATPLPTVEPTESPTETVTPTSTTAATATSTVTPTPTQTPTPIVGETAVVNTGTSTVWMRRTPGGQNLAVLQGGDVVLILTGHASRANILWQEIRTVDGAVGWVETDYLATDEAEE